MVSAGCSWCCICVVRFLWSSARNRWIGGDVEDRVNGQLGAIMQAATFINTVGGYNGDMRLYRVEPPVAYSKGGRLFASDYVVVSTAQVLYTGPETCIFPSDERGKVLSWSALEGSYRGGLDHVAALNGAGYRVKQTSRKAGWFSLVFQ